MAKLPCVHLVFQVLNFRSSQWYLFCVEFNLEHFVIVSIWLVLWAPAINLLERNNVSSKCFLFLLFALSTAPRVTHMDASNNSPRYTRTTHSYPTPAISYHSQPAVGLISSHHSYDYFMHYNILYNITYMLCELSCPNGIASRFACEHMSTGVHVTMLNVQFTRFICAYPYRNYTYVLSSYSFPFATNE